MLHLLITILYLAIYYLNTLIFYSPILLFILHYFLLFKFTHTYSLLHQSTTLIPSYITLIYSSLYFIILNLEYLLLQLFHSSSLFHYVFKLSFLPLIFHPVHLSISYFITPTNNSPFIISSYSKFLFHLLPFSPFLPYPFYFPSYSLCLPTLLLLFLSY